MSKSMLLWPDSRIGVLTFPARVLPNIRRYQDAQRARREAEEREAAARATRSR